jgi:hypothetical protein
MIGTHDSLLAMAEEANVQLWPRLSKIITGETDTSGEMPNLISVDALDCTATTVALWINKHFHRSASDAYNPAMHPAPKARLDVGDTLEPGEAVVSPNGKFELRFGTNCGLTVAQTGSQSPITIVPPPSPARVGRYAMLKPGGDLVTFGSSGRTRAQCWTSGFTDAKTGWLAVTDDGVVVLYDTQGKPLRRLPDFAGDELPVGRVARAGERIYSKSRQTYLVQQYDGNLMLYDARSATSSSPIWAPQSMAGKAGQLLRLETGPAAVRVEAHANDPSPQWRLAFSDASAAQRLNVDFTAYGEPVLKVIDDNFLLGLRDPAGTKRRWVAAFPYPGGSPVAHDLSDAMSILLAGQTMIGNFSFTTPKTVDGSYCVLSCIGDGWLYTGKAHAGMPLADQHTLSAGLNGRGSTARFQHIMMELNGDLTFHADPGGVYETLRNPHGDGSSKGYYFLQLTADANAVIKDSDGNTVHTFPPR